MKPIKSKTVKSKKTLSAADRKRNAESSLWMKLQNEHGYTLKELGKKEPKTALMFHLGEGTSYVVRFIVLGVPAKSVLGQALEAASQKQAPKARR
jgi:hypothetical protein